MKEIAEFQEMLFVKFQEQFYLTFDEIKDETTTNYPTGGYDVYIPMKLLYIQNHSAESKVPERSVCLI